MPPRREHETDEARWPPGPSGKRVYVSCGRGRLGIVREVFLRGGSKVGSEFDCMLDDVAVLLSRCLQHGDRLEDIAAGMGRGPDGAPLSVLAAAVDAALVIEREGR